MTMSQETSIPAIVAPQVLLSNRLKGLEASYICARVTKKSPWSRRRTAPIIRAICCACAKRPLRECIPARLPLRIKIFTFLVWGFAIYGLVMFVTGIFGLR
jgi:hypothetical protein